MRQIVLDTETTGLDTADGHRVIEIGAVEIIDRRLTRRTFHHYLNPDREIDVGAAEVHGITLDKLVDKPRFAEIIEDFLAFVRDGELIIHNAPFDIGFLNHELGLARHDVSDLNAVCKVLDSLYLARRMHPGQRNSLDALCRRYEIDNSRREYHGALLDAEILADVYLAMTGGQAALSLGEGSDARVAISTRPVIEHAPLRVVRASEAELRAHESRLDAIDDASGGPCIWRSGNASTS
jgi:DNA polymerase-3 subunit epsilon